MIPKSHQQLDDITLTASQRLALDTIRRRLHVEFRVETVILYGSVARGTADEESDVDLLVILPQPFTLAKRHEITDMVCEVNLAFETNFSTLVVDRWSWEYGPISVLPIKKEIIREGIPV